MAGTENALKFGTLERQVIILDDDWWKPLTDDEIDDLIDGW